MDSKLRDRLSSRMNANLMDTTVQVKRLTQTPDGQGGQTQDWRVIMTIPARLVNKQNNEVVMGDAIKVSCSWVLVAPVTANILAKDRIVVDKDSRHYFDVVATDAGQTNLLVQHIGLQENF